MGWEAAETVVHEHDEAGRLVASRVTREVEWDQWQRSLVLASIDIEGAVGAHGIPLWDARNPTAVDPDGEFHFVVDAPVHDFAAEAEARARRAWREANKDADDAGIVFPVRKVLARDP